MNAGVKPCRFWTDTQKVSVWHSEVQDDILDVVGDTATLGKRQGADQQLGKSTYPALLGLEHAQRKARDLIDDARQSLNELAAQSLDTSALEALADYIIQRDK